MANVALFPWLVDVSALFLCVFIIFAFLFFKNRNIAKRQCNLMRLVNDTAALLLESAPGDYYEAIAKSMEMIRGGAEIDHLYLWQNQRKEDGKLYYRQICKLQHENLADDCGLPEFAYQENIPGWEETLLKGKTINGPVDTLPEINHIFLANDNIKSVLAVPMFMNDTFWGFASFDNCSKRRVYDESEENLLRSWGLLAASAIERGKTAVNMQHTLTKLEAVISNYKGIIWSIDKDKMITTFNGKYAKEIGIEPSMLVGKHIDEAGKYKDLFNIAENAGKTLNQGAQECTSDIDGRIFQSSTSPMYDMEGKLIGAVGSTDDVTEVVTLQRQLKTAVEVAVTASETKSRFLTNMSHEMRTPLNAIIGLSELELGASNLDAGSFVNVEKIYSAGMTLLGIINDLLDISKIEAGRFSLIPVVYDISSLINDTINLNIVRIGSKPVQLRLHVDGSLPARLEGDELRVRQIFTNFLSNAIKYTDEGFVDWSISCAREGERIKVTSVISDTGRGISKEEQEKLFKDYYQADLKANYYVEGTGLGLSITKNLVKLMDGTITLESEYGSGSAFTVEFYQQAAGNEVIGDEVAENLSQFRYSAQRRSRNQKLIRADMSYASVLVVDDVPTNFDVAKGMLKPYKMHVDCVRSGKEAVNRIRDEKVHYNAIFMDHMMPGMNGIEATKIIREEIGTEYAKTIPIIALTANAIMGNDVMFLESGFQAFLAKPIDILRLDQVLNQIVRNRDKEREMRASSAQAPAAEEAVQAKTGLFDSLSIPDLDHAGGLARFEGDEEVYLQVLRSFAVHAPSFVQTAGTLHKTNDLDAYRIAVHSLKGSTRGIGAEKAGDMAEKLEAAARQNDTDYIETNTSRFVEVMEKLLDGINEFLKTINEDSGPEKPEKDFPDMNLLDVLNQAAENYDMTLLKDAIAALDEWKYTSHPD